MGRVSAGRVVAALRARQWIHFALLPAAPLAARALDGEAVVRAARGGATAALALAFAYGLNAATDRATDEPGKNPLPPRGPLPRALPPLLALCAALALAIAATAGASALAFAAASISAGALYGAGGKRLPLVGTLLNPVIFTPLLRVAPAATAPLGALPWVFVALLLQNQLLHERADEREDERGRALTTGRLVGERGVRWLVVALGALGAIASALAARATGEAATALLALVAPTAMALRARLPAARRRDHRSAALASGAGLWLVAGAW